MTNTKILITFLGFVLIISACGKVTGLEDTSGKLDSNQLQKATEQFCSQNQTLQELKDGTDTNFDQLNYRTRIFAFVGKDSSKKCIIEEAVNLSYSDGTWFSINPLNNCLKNGSVWSVESQESGTNKYYTMKMIDDPSLRIMNMNGDRRISGTFLSENLGLKLLVCVNK